jgi:DNA-binding transcriptional regulator YdaS (Cro superfamily)
MRAKQVPPSTDPNIIRAEKKAQKMLYAYMRQRHGIQQELARETGIKASFLSRLANRDNQVIAMETAILIELASKGELKAELLCPARADVIKRFLAARQPESAPCSPTA